VVVSAQVDLSRLSNATQTVASLVFGMGMDASVMLVGWDNAAETQTNLTLEMIFKTWIQNVYQIFEIL
jgi:hypothetical protein